MIKWFFTAGSRISECVTCGKALKQISEYHEQHQILGCVKPQQHKMTAFFPKAPSLSASTPCQLDGAERALLPQQAPETRTSPLCLTCTMFGLLSSGQPCARL
jgi:hypothetical protein